MLDPFQFNYDAASFVKENRTLSIDKSLLSNLLAAGLTIVGLNLEPPVREYVLNTGLFALSGGVTNWLAIHMLFEKVPGFYGSGVIPLRFEEFKLGIRKLIMDQFFNHSNFDNIFENATEVSEKLEEKLQSSLENLDLETVFESLLDVIMNSSYGSMLGMFGGRDALDALKSPFVEKMKEHFTELFQRQSFHEQMQEAVRSAIDNEAVRGKLEQLIDQRLDQMTPQMVKQIIQDMIKKHLGWLVVWGTVFGGTIGLVVTVVSGL